MPLVTRGAHKLEALLVSLNGAVIRTVCTERVGKRIQRQVDRAGIVQLAAALETTFEVTGRVGYVAAQTRDDAQPAERDGSIGQVVDFACDGECLEVKVMGTLVDD